MLVHKLDVVAAHWSEAISMARRSDLIAVIGIQRERFLE